MVVYYWPGTTPIPNPHHDIVFGVWRGRVWWLGGPNRAHSSNRGIENSACDLLIVESRGAMHSVLLSHWFPNWSPKLHRVIAL